MYEDESTRVYEDESTRAKQRCTRTSLPERSRDVRGRVYPSEAEMYEDESTRVYEDESTRVYEDEST
ncbi:hypothetical protein EOD39_18820 [Acipenser ruthenus]|uniref:Uncharacterized protein n=1 Tax=Acipenser ruthenus TaxID=7906 RepID=A0A444UZU1_ACIRT|nr:hypothetical protein EOD39_18820 [Acipenser ruthenus]